jgi:hypothetical protein
MQFKNLFLLILPLLTLGVSAQNKVFSFNQFQVRNNIQQWGNVEKICTQTVRFTNQEIDLNIDQKYHLNIESKTDLPDKGVIYLCKDENLNPITVMIFGNSSMYLYTKNKRFLIYFDEKNDIVNNVADTD